MAAAAFQGIADRLTKALISGDFALYRSLMLLPLRVTPRGAASYVLSQEEDLRADFDLYHQTLTLQGVTDIFRDVQEVTIVAPGEAVIHMTTHIMQRAYRIVEPLLSRFFLRLVGEDWLIFEIESTAGHISWALGRARLTPQGQFEQSGGGDAEA